MLTRKSFLRVLGITAILAVVGLVSLGLFLAMPESPATSTGAVVSVDSTLPGDLEQTSAPASPVLEDVWSPSIPSPDPVGTAARARVGGDEPETGISNTPIHQSVSALHPVEISIDPVEDWNPIKTQHTFTITVKEEDGTPADGIEVEVILNRFGEAVGDIVSLGGENPRKVDNTFGRVITDANGQGTLTITSTREGDTDVTVYAPEIEDASAHKVFAVKHWVDMNGEFPGDAVNLVGTNHPMEVRITRVSDGSPRAGIEVVWSIIDDDPDAGLDGSDNTVTTTTDADGIASVTLSQVLPAVGDNTVSIEVIHEESEGVLLSSLVTKEWRSPSLVVAKTGPESLGLSKTSEFTVTVTNTGNSVASDITLTDTLPVGLNFVSSVPAESSSSGSEVSWSLGNLEPGGIASITMVLSASAVGEQVNVATALSTEGITGQGQSVTNVIPGSLTLVKSAPDSVLLDDEFQYQITVTNDGEGALTNVVLSDALPDGASLVSTEPTTTTSGQQVEWTIAQLDASASETFTITAEAIVLGSVTNTVSAQSAEGATASAEASTTVITSDVTVTKTVDRPTLVLGEGATFTITVTNNGDAEATNVSVVDLLPAGLTPISTVPDTGAALGEGLEWTIDSLAAGASSTITVNTVSALDGVITNVVQVTDRGSTVTAEATVEVQTPAIDLSKTGGTALYIDGERDYILTAINIGDADLTGVTITDTIPESMSYISSDANGVAGAGTVTWSVGDLARGGSVTVTVRLKGEAAGAVTNVANVTSDQGASDEATLDITVLAAAGAHLQIIDQFDPLGVGDEGAFTVTIRNQSADSTITNVNLSVITPDEFEILTADGGATSGGQITYTVIPSLGAGQEQQFTITVRAIQAGDVITSATMSYDEFARSITAQEGTTIISR